MITGQRILFACGVSLALYTILLIGVCVPVPIAIVAQNIAYAVAVITAPWLHEQTFQRLLHWRRARRLPRAIARSTKPKEPAVITLNCCGLCFLRACWNALVDRVWRRS